MPMGIDDKRKVAALIVRKVGERENMSEKPNRDGAEQDNSIAMQSAADEMIRAFEAKDSRMLVAALRSFIEMAKDMEDSEES